MKIIHLIFITTLCTSATHGMLSLAPATQRMAAVALKNPALLTALARHASSSNNDQRNAQEEARIRKALTEDIVGGTMAALGIAALAGSAVLLFIAADHNPILTIGSLSAAAATYNYFKHYSHETHAKKINDLESQLNNLEKDSLPKNNDSTMPSPKMEDLPKKDPNAYMTAQKSADLSHHLAQQAKNNNSNYR